MTNLSGRSRRRRGGSLQPAARRHTRSPPHPFAFQPPGRRLRPSSSSMRRCSCSSCLWSDSICRRSSANSSSAVGGGLVRREPTRSSLRLPRGICRAAGRWRFRAISRAKPAARFASRVTEAVAATPAAVGRRPGGGGGGGIVIATVGRAADGGGGSAGTAPLPAGFPGAGRRPVYAPRRPESAGHWSPPAQSQRWIVRSAAALGHRRGGHPFGRRARYQPHLLAPDAVAFDIRQFEFVARPKCPDQSHEVVGRADAFAVD